MAWKFYTALGELKQVQDTSSHPDLSTHDALGLATDSELTTHAATPHGPYPQVDIYTADDTWTKPSGCAWVEVIAIGGGGGGGAGRRFAEGNNRSGGGGGGGGAYIRAAFPASVLGGTEAVVVGQGGAGGINNVTTDSNGDPGSHGTDSTFGDEPWVRADGGERGGGGGATSGAAGAGGFDPDNAASTLAPTVASGAFGFGGSGEAGSNNAASTIQSPIPFNSGFALMTGAGGGGGAGGRDSGNANALGVDGQDCYDKVGGDNGGVLGTPAATDGESAVANNPEPGAGGGGGSGGTGSGDLSGGNGGLYGGGGGGGGGKSNQATNNSGGDGADGIVVVVSW